ncbi:unnamed protein product, partial [Larinioides sclopetarius]
MDSEAESMPQTNGVDGGGMAEPPASFPAIVQESSLPGWRPTQQGLKRRREEEDVGEGPSHKRTRAEEELQQMVEENVGTDPEDGASEDVAMDENDMATDCLQNEIAEATDILLEEQKELLEQLMIHMEERRNRLEGEVSVLREALLAAESKLAAQAQ